MRCDVRRPGLAVVPAWPCCVEALGADSLVHGQLTGEGSGPAVTVRVEGARRIAAGETLPLAVAPEHVHFFEVGNGYRIV